jgi:hypothetical protein
MDLYMCSCSCSCSCLCAVGRSDDDGDDDGDDDDQFHFIVGCWLFFVVILWLINPIIPKPMPWILCCWLVRFS